MMKTTGGELSFDRVASELIMNLPPKTLHQLLELLRMTSLLNIFMNFITLNF